MKITTKYRLKSCALAGLVALYCVGFLLTIGRWYSVIDSDFVVLTADIHSHISNFSLSILVYLSIGYMWLSFGVKFRFVALLGMLMVIANFICETLMGFMNTTDIIDAIYGTIGIAITFVYLFFTYKYGLLSKNEDDS